MRTEADGVVTYRAGYYYRLSLWSMVIVTLVLLIALTVGTDGGSRILPALFLPIFLAGGWWVGLRPRVELHSDHLRVLTPDRSVTLRYAELRSPEFSGSYAMTGPLLELSGRFDRVTVWPGGGGQPPRWQVDLQQELLERISQLP